MKEGEEIDILFKKRMEGPANNLAYNEDDWDALEQMLDAGKKRPFMIYWLPIVSGVAAMLLLVAGWYFFKAQTTEQHAGQVIVKKQPVHTPADTISKANPQAPVVALAKPANNFADNDSTAHRNGSGGTPFNVAPVVKKKVPTQQNAGANILAASGFTTPSAVNGNLPGSNNLANVNANGITIRKDTVPPAHANMVAIRKDTVSRANANLAAMQKDTTPPVRVNDAQQAMAAQTQPAKATGKVKTKTVTFGLNRPQFSISVLASGDVTGVNSLQQGKAGSNFGAMFSVTVKKWTVTTGAMYAIKPYKTAFSNYITAYQFKQAPTEVTADCRMLDIPLNIGYKVYQKGKNKFALGTGLTSYFMLHENYKYTYAANTTGPAGYQVDAPKNYLLSTINLNATFEHQVNSKFSLSVQPYMKLPLATVGYSQVNLHTAGVALGFNWNINSFTKPK